MFELQLTVSNDYLFIVGCTNANRMFDKHVCKLSVTFITNSTDQQRASTRWVALTQTMHSLSSSLVTGLSSLIVTGGRNAAHTTTTGIIMYDNSSGKWKKINSLSFAKCRFARHIFDIIVVGGYTSLSDTKSTSVTSSSGTRSN